MWIHSTDWYSKTSMGETSHEKMILKEFPQLSIQYIQYHMAKITNQSSDIMASIHLDCTFTKLFSLVTSKTKITPSAFL